MLDLTQFFIAPAYAQAVPMPPGAESGSPNSALMSFMPYVLIILVLYVLLFRPQQKKMDEQQKMIKGLQRGDRVITTGGLHGKIARLDDETIMLEIADGVQVKALRSHIIGLEAKPNPVVANKDDGKKS